MTADLHLVAFKTQVFIVPQSILGVLWLQLHFKDEDWNVIAEGHFTIPRHDAAMLVIDAQTAELNVRYD